MQLREQRFQLQQSSDFFPKVVWPYLLVLGLLYYVSVVFELKMPFALLVLGLLIFLLDRQKRSGICLLQTDAEKMILQYRKGLLWPSSVSTEYFWKDLAEFQAKTSPDEQVHLTLHWQIWDDQSLWGKDSKAFTTYLRTHFPEKETHSPHSL